MTGPHFHRFDDHFEEFVRHDDGHDCVGKCGDCDTDGASEPNLRAWIIAAAVTFLGVLALFVALVIYCGNK